MALFGQQPRKDEPVPNPSPESSRRRRRSGLRIRPHTRSPPPAPMTTRRVEEAPMSMTTPRGSESILSAGLTIEGKIEGNGNIRVAGRFKGNVNVKGELTIEPGASIDGEVKADTVSGRGRGPRAPDRELARGVQGVRHAHRRPEGGEPDGGGRLQDARQGRVRLEGRGSRSPLASRAEGTEEAPPMTGEAWNCPHCGERILRSAPTCPACLRHLRFDAVRWPVRREPRSPRSRWTARSGIRVTRRPGSTRCSSRSTTSGTRWSPVGSWAWAPSGPARDESSRCGSRCWSRSPHD